MAVSQVEGQAGTARTQRSASGSRSQADNSTNIDTADMVGVKIKHLKIGIKNM